MVKMCESWVFQSRFSTAELAGCLFCVEISMKKEFSKSKEIATLPTKGYSLMSVTGLSRKNCGRQIYPPEFLKAIAPSKNMYDRSRNVTPITSSM